MEDEYFKQLICNNCLQYQGGIIPKGTTIKEYCGFTECIKCGCKELRQLNADETKDY